MFLNMALVYGEIIDSVGAGLSESSDSGKTIEIKLRLHYFSGILNNQDHSVLKLFTGLASADLIA